MSVLLGVLQGVSEFLPISSSGHLQILRRLFGSGLQGSGLSHDVFLHAGTLLATMIVFRRRLAAWLKSLSNLTQQPRSQSDNQNLKYLLLVCVASVPVLVLGFVFRGGLEQRFSSMFLVGLGYATTTIFLLATIWVGRSKGRPKTIETCSYGFAVVVGLAQGLALMPGGSRSGITIATALLLGTERKFAGEFSFMLSLPAIAGAIVLEGFGVVAEAKHRGLNAIPIADYGIGFLTSFAVGFLSLLLLMKVVRSGKIHLFGAYTFALMILSWALAWA